MSETEDEWAEPLAVIGLVLAVLVGVANYAGTACTEFPGVLYDGMIYLGDSMAVLGLAGGVVAFTANRFVDPHERRPTQRQRPSSDGTAGGFGGRDARPTQTQEREEPSSRSWTLLAAKLFLAVLVTGGLLTLAGWWLANTYDVQCASGFWSGFLSGMIPP